MVQQRESIRRQDARPSERYPVGPGISIDTAVDCEQQAFIKSKRRDTYIVVRSSSDPLSSSRTVAKHMSADGEARLHHVEGSALVCVIDVRKVEAGRGFSHDTLSASREQDREKTTRS
jgi:hypothetical protein